LQNPKVAMAIASAAERLAIAHPAELVRLIASGNEAIALGAIQRAMAMKTPTAVAPLAKVLADGSLPLRSAAVQALTEIASPGALQALERSISDRDRDVRIAAVRALSARAYRGVLTRLEAIVKGKSIREADLTERMAFFEAYGALCGDTGVPFLDDILNAKGMFSKREDPEIRACAAIALGRLGTSRARECLQRAASEKDVVVRNAVTRALRRESIMRPGGIDGIGGTGAS
jgi:HEAT repeat protein